MVVLDASSLPAHLLKGSQHHSAMASHLQSPSVTCLEGFQLTFSTSCRLVPPLLRETCFFLLAENRIRSQATSRDLLLAVIGVRNQRHHSTISLQARDKRRQVNVSVQAARIQVLGSPVARHDRHDARVPHGVEERREQATVLDCGDGHLIKAQQCADLLHNALGHVVRGPNSRCIPLRLMDHSVNQVHELVEVHSPASA
mmetsp:Transcript_81394/g.264209  ORF Transcript_81394/g.264209 Transcript_81394/m.264209 type:complete len:200 (+) Transcript_81394:675-1274(+)